MTITNTSLTFTTKDQSVWSPGTAVNLYVDTGDFLIFDSGELSKHWSIDAFIIEASFDTYMSVRFGLLGWANLGSSGSWDASYEIDVFVDHPAAILSGRMMNFDFSNYEILSAEISSKGFGPGEDGIAAGLKLIIDIEAGVRDIYVDWPWPFGSDSYGGFKLVDIDEEIDLITVSLQIPDNLKYIPKRDIDSDGKLTISPTEIIYDFGNGLELIGRLPQGADTEGDSTGSGIVTGTGVSDINFIELSADLDELLLELLGKIPSPATQAAVKTLGNTVFAEHTYDLHDYVDFVPADKVELKFTFLDIGATAGLALTEDLTLDITEKTSDRPDINIKLTSDNGTPDNVADDTTVAVGKLGEVISLLSPSSSTVGTATVTAEYSINRAHVTHDIGLALTFGITIDYLMGSLEGDWVPSFLEVEFGPLKKIEFPAEDDDSWDISLGTIYSHDFEVSGSIFNVDTDAYEVFFVDPAAAPVDWDPTLPGAEEAIYGYFEANYKQIQALYDKYVPDSSFVLRPQLINGVPELDWDYSTETDKVFFGWNAAYAGTVHVNTSNGSLVMVAPSVTDGGDNIIQDNLYAKPGGSTFITYATNWQTLLNAQGNDGSVTYLYNNKLVQSFGPTSAVGQNRGDALVYAGGTFYDGKLNLIGTHDLFFADFVAAGINAPIYWDLAESVAEENDGSAATMGGVTLHLGVNNDVVVRNVEAMAVRTGSGDDYLVGGTYTDVMRTGAGDDIVKLVYSIVGGGVDVADDYVSLGSGDDTAIVELGNIPTLQASEFTDYILGGTGVDNVFVRSGLQGLRYDVSFDSGGTPVRLFGAEGIGADASHSALTALLSHMTQTIVAEYDVGAETSDAPGTYFMLMNGGMTQGRIEISTDVESVSIIVDEGSADQGIGDDLVVFQGGTRYDGGAGGVDTFAADFSAYEWRFGTRGGLQLNVANPVSYFGETAIARMDRLHVVGTTDADVIFGGAYDDFISGGSGDDYISGGVDSAADELFGGVGDDRFFWTQGGNDMVFGGAGFDTLNISSLNINDGKAGNNLWHAFYNQTGSMLLSVDADSYGEEILAALDLIKSGGYAMQKINMANVSVEARSIEAINIVSTMPGYDDLVFYQGGNYYDAGEDQSPNENDTFAADFRDQEAAVDFQVPANPKDDIYYVDPGKFLDNGVFIRGFERGIILGGSGNDILSGGARDDFFLGGLGNDILNGNGGNDVLDGGEGSDTFFYDGDGYDVITGGTNTDGTAELDHLVIGGGSGDTRVVLQDQAGNDILTADHGMVFADSSRADIHDLALKSLTATQWLYYNSTPGNPNNRTDPSLTHVTYTGMEAVDIAGTADYDDVIVYQYGAGYVGGERAGDADIFVADLREFSEDLTIDVTMASGVAYDIGQGTQIADFERFSVLMGDGNDFVQGGDLDDTAYGGGGDDELSGGLGDDVLHGQGGDDLFDHIGGNDEVQGGSGNDALAISDLSAAFRLSFFDNSDNKIGITYSTAAGGPSFADFTALYAITTDDYMVLRHGTSSVKVRGIEEIVASSGDGNDVLISGTLQGVMFAGGGNDILIGRSGNDFMSGGGGDDTYVFGQGFGNDIIFGETAESSRLVFTGYQWADLDFTVSGTDLYVGAGTNSVQILGYFDADATLGLDFTFEVTDGTFTKDFNNTGTASGGRSAAFTPGGIVYLGTNADEDILVGTPYSDQLRGFGGDDFIESSGGSDLLDGGAGRDAVSYLKSSAGVSVDLLNFQGHGGDAEGDLLVSIEHVGGSLFNDTLTGNRFKNNIFGEDGNDQISGLDGDDLLTGDAGSDTVDGGDGNDRLYGGDGNDIVRGGAGIDYLAGGDGKDVLAGGNDDDILDDGLGNDIANGGRGGDFFFYGGGKDTWNGGKGSDVAEFERFGAAVEVHLDGLSDVVTRDGADMRAATGTLRSLVSMTNIENVRGSEYADRLFGDDGDNRIEGNLGDDLVVGNAGSDTMIGGAGIDTLDYSQEGGTSGIMLALNLPSDPGNHDSYGDVDYVTGFEVIIGTSRGDTIRGDETNNYFYGGAGSDTLAGRSGNDMLSGDAGQDIISGGDGNDILSGGSGADTVRGGLGDDLLIGGEGGADVYYGDNGFDTISYAMVSTALLVDLRLASNQVTGAGPDAETLKTIENVIGGSGDDKLIGNGGNNWFSYSGGTDIFNGLAGQDTAVFSYFDAAVSVDLTAADEARTRDGVDLSSGKWRTIAQLTNIENVIGSDHDDRLTGDTGRNRLFGGGGNDTFDGGRGNDAMFGGEGDDRFVGRPGDGADLYDGGAGTDMLDYSSLAAGVSASLVDGDGNDAVMDIEWLIGSNFNDTLSGNAGANILQGGGGNDVLLAGEGDDVLIYDGGVDEMYGEVGNDTVDFSLFGAAIDLNLGRTDSVYSGDTQNWNTGTARQLAAFQGLDIENALGTAFNDRLIGNDQANMFNGGIGNDRILGKGGDDMFTYADGLDYWNGGSGADTANYSTYRFAVFVSLAQGSAQTQDAAMIGSGTWRDITTFAGFENAIGSVFDDILRGSADANTLSGWAGNDKLFGLAGKDSLQGGAGDDTLFGGTGADTLDGGAGRDMASYELAKAAISANLGTGKGLLGEAFGDVLVAIEDLTGSDFDDTLTGDAQANLLIGGLGNDTVAGGNGDDTLVYTDGLDDWNGGAGFDTGDFSSFQFAVWVNLEATTDQARTRGNAGLKTGTWQTLAAVADVENVIGGDANDKLLGNALINVLRGGAGNDQLTGGAADDELIGDAGNDRLDGGTGSDHLVGGTGRDTASYLSAASSVTASLANSSINSGDAKGDTFTNIEALLGSTFDDDLRGDGAANVIDGAAGNDVLHGGGGADKLTGGRGTDMLFGGAGRDRFAFDRVQDSGTQLAARDTIADFTVKPAKSAAFIDRIDLSAIDARADTAGNQAFTFIGNTSFTADGQINAVQSGSDTVININTSSAPGAEMKITLLNFTATDLQAVDFIL